MQSSRNVFFREPQRSGWVWRLAVNVVKRKQPELRWIPLHKAEGSPLLVQEGWPSRQKILPKASFERHGRGGHSGLTTPSALSKVASQHFLDAQPPLLYQEGTTHSGTQR